MKWNERERQKSFVVVEEGPEKPKKKASREGYQESIKEDAEEDIGDEEDEEEEEEDEEEKFDIDDKNSSDAATEAEAKLKAREDHDARKAATAIINRSGLNVPPSTENGISTPSRYAGPVPHPRPISPRHLGRSNNSSPEDSSAEHEDHRVDGEHGYRDDIRSPRTAKESSRSRIPRNRDLEADVSTPRPHDGYKKQYPPMTQQLQEPVRHRRHRSLSPNTAGRRAFAVWGHDESDSNPSDSEPNA